MDDKKTLFYTTIFTNIQHDNSISLGARLLSGDINSLTQKEGYCWATNKYFAEIYDVSEVTISKWIKELIDAGYIKAEYLRKGRQYSQRRIMLSGIKNLGDKEKFNTRDKEKFNTGIKEKFKHNNIIYNNINEETNSSEPTVPSIGNSAEAEISFRGSLRKDNNITNSEKNNTINSEKNKESEDKENIEEIISSENKSNINIIDSEDIFNIDSSVDNIKDIQPENDIINYWNKFSCFSKHKKRTTKVYKLSNIYCNKLLNHTFLESYKIDKDWRTDNSLRLHPLKTLTEKDLKKAILNYSLQFEEEYKPADKSRLPKSFPNFVYNPKTGKSQLLWMLNYEPQKMDAPDLHVFRNRLPDYVRTKVDQILDYKYPTISDKNKFQVYVNTNNTLKHIHKLSETMLPYQKNKQNFIIHLSKNDDKGFITKWLNYLENLPKISVRDFSNNSFVFNNFLEYLSREFTVDLDDSPQHLKALERGKRQVARAKGEESKQIRPAKDIDEVTDMMSAVF